MVALLYSYIVTRLNSFIISYRLGYGSLLKTVQTFDLTSRFSNNSGSPFSKVFTLKLFYLRNLCGNIYQIIVKHTHRILLRPFLV